MKKLITVLSLAVVLLLAACSSSTFNPKKENVEVEQVLEKVRESEQVLEEHDLEKIEYEDKMQIKISLKEFLYNYYEIAQVDDLQVVDKILDPILSHSVSFSSYPYISVDFNVDKNNTIREVACFKECTDDYQDAIKKALNLNEMKYGKDYKIEEYYEESEDGETYDVFKVSGN